MLHHHIPHDDLHTSFSSISFSSFRQVNFINGRNGSGKSAILAALQICLGAKAHLTHRAKKMADFIRSGLGGHRLQDDRVAAHDQGRLGIARGDARCATLVYSSMALALAFKKIRNIRGCCGLGA